MTEDSRALHSADAQDPDRMGAILEDFRPRLARMIEVRLDPALRGRIDASDIVQEAYVEVAERLPQYMARRDMPFFLWVRFLTSQKLLQVHRRHLDAGMRDPRREVPLQRGGFADASTITLASAILDSAGSPSEIAMQDEAREGLVRALADLSPLDREILAMRHFERMSLAETARLLELSESATSRRHVRALSRLQQHMRQWIEPSDRPSGPKA